MWKQTRVVFSSLLLPSLVALAGFSQGRQQPALNHLNQVKQHWDTLRHGTHELSDLEFNQSLIPEKPGRLAREYRTHVLYSDSGDSSNDLNALLKKIGERAVKYQEDLYHLAWTQTNNWQPLTDKLKPKGKAKEAAYDAVMLRKPSAANPQIFQPALRFELKSIDGKPARERKVVQNSPEQYGQANGHYQLFLLPERQSQYAFSRGGETSVQGRKAVILAMTPVAYAKPQLKIENCHFQVTPIPFPRKGKIWVDADTFNVLQVQWELIEAFGAHVNFGVCVKGIFPITRPDQDIVYERLDTIIRFQAIAFREPDQTLLLPSTIEETHVIKGARNPASRITVAFTDYKRFGSDVKFNFPDKDGQ